MEKGVEYKCEKLTKFFEQASEAKKTLEEIHAQLQK